VINVHTIKPLDKETIVQSAKKTKRVFCAEDHNVIGGLGSAVAELLGESYPVPIKLHGVYDEFTESGAPKDLWKKYKLDKKGVQEALLQFIKK
jgi:transketolase